MPRARKRRRRRRRRSSRAQGPIEAAGAVALVTIWSLCARAVRYGFSLLGRAWRWFLRQETAVQTAVAAALLLLGAVTVYVRVFSEPAPIALDDDAETLARVIRSEIGTGNMQQRLHVAWVTRNLAERRGQTLAQMACSPCGPQEAGRPVSTLQAALDIDRVLAREVLDAPELLDPTGGATHFINPQLQDQLAKRGTPGYRGRPYRLVRRQWKGYGWEPYYRLGPELEFWGPKRSR